MSTILDALRKAKQTPLQNSVDARPEVLSGDAHNYLASIPDSPDSQLRNLRTILLVAGGVIVVLFALVIILLTVTLRKINSNSAVAALPGKTVELAKSEAHAEPTAVPVVTPALPTPTPIVVYIATSTPAPASTPVSPVVVTPVPGGVLQPGGAQTPAAAPTATVNINPTPVGVAATTDAAPFEFPVQPVTEALELRGILWDETSPMAMINGRTVQQGTVLGGYTIKSIQKNCVIVVAPNGEEKTLRP
jgi:hypothetical protein